MWWQNTAPTKGPRLPYITVLLAVGMILGSIPGIVYHLTITQQKPTSLWDSRPCYQLPSPQTCNGILPYAPSDYIAVHGKPPESGLCIDQNTEHWAAPITTFPDYPAHIYGMIHLWWSPRCQSSFAETRLTIDLMSSRLTTSLSMENPANNPWLKKKTYTLISQVEADDREVRTPLLWSPGRMVSVCGSLTFQSQTYEGCISPQLMQFPTPSIPFERKTRVEPFKG